MAILPILNYPDPRLHTVAKPVAEVDAGIRRLIDDMAETMYAAPGIGLAATQVDVHQQVIVMDISEDRSDLRVFINPRIVASEGVQDYEEGCLSVPGIYETVTRAGKRQPRRLPSCRVMRPNVISAACCASLPGRAA